MKAVIFDCFGVLYLNSSQHFYETHVANYEQLRPELQLLIRECDYGLITQQELTEAVADMTGLSLSFIRQNIEGIHRRNDDLLTYSQTLRGRYKVGMLSNIGVGGMDRYFSLQERRELFDAVVLSGEEGITKPHPYIYEIIASRLGVSTGECVMIDDIEDNCAGADAAGMKAIYYRSNLQVKEELEAIIAPRQA